MEILCLESMSDEVESEGKVTRERDHICGEREKKKIQMNSNHVDIHG